MKRVLFLAVALLLSMSCNVERSAARKVDKAVSKTSPDWVMSYVYNKYRTSVKHDTVYISKQDTIKLEGKMIIDTLKERDTLFIERDKVKMQVIRIRDTIKAKAECITDTVYIEKSVDYTQVNKNAEKVSNNIQKNNNRKLVITFLFLGSIILFLLFTLFILYR